jgi:hypothetical protein
MRTLVTAATEPSSFRKSGVLAFVPFRAYALITMPALIIHGHFYQPPREIPGPGSSNGNRAPRLFTTGTSGFTLSATNPTRFVELSDRTINNYANISFNFGPRF